MTSESPEEMQTHLSFLKQALDLASLSPPRPTNFRVGCIIVSQSPSPNSSVLATGYTIELPGNTHAEQNALSKLAAQHSVPETRLNEILTPELNAVLYTTLEPCGKRLSGNLSCVERIIATRAGRAAANETNGAGIRKVIFGAREPGTFIQDSKSLPRLGEAGVEWVYVPGLEEEILKVAMAGHDNNNTSPERSQQQNSEFEMRKGVGIETRTQARTQTESESGTNVDDITPEERRRQEALPRNPKKRMMEVDVNQ
ncbi:uncharacterized protein Z518_10694 [Rhinocladiella mackenziei CBS 650.93]|uniref:CMP/dCMP-type deaminase domain-containing protein n=1 Tax=Rhinocladiella mackenziei CBS 650.93 TaxID=1442369 RepID=A0A0D2FCD4_9EURO|nr:uncharacterized protein Z518_10694 [Rhinocladiella mackenziei CBS 650.93]KIW99766.1 hypothetical protein Z518_10694 [Rhinocladiella mackenziei CBS 650.93]